MNDTSPIDFSDLDQLPGPEHVKGYLTTTASPLPAGLIEASLAYQERTLKSTTQQRIEVKCEKCRGTGQWRMFNGQVGGECFTCHGTGKILRAASYEANKAKRERAKQREADDAEERETSRRQTNIDKFKALRPELAAWLVTNTSDFALSLREAVANYGSLSVAQEHAIRRNLPADCSTAIPAQPRFPKIVALVTEKNMKLRLGECTVTAFRSGTVAVVAPVFGGGTFGVFNGAELRRYKGMTDSMFATLQDVEARGIVAVQEIGKALGTCCCCGRALSDPYSIEHGIGPICAAKLAAGMGA